MNVTKKIVYHFLICCSITFFGINISFSQNFSVSKYQKINELNGGFNGVLDIDDSWAISIDNIGDIDGNGVNDLAVGAFGDDDGGSNKGAVWILFLDANDLVIANTKISNTSGNFNGVLDNEDRFGGGVANLGDMNNDGLTELAVTADYDGDGGFWHGAVWILSLNNDGTVNSYSKISDFEGGFTGFINGDAIFGTDIENIGDLNSDGIDDLAFGSRRDADGGSARGAVWILFMNADFTVNSFQKISDTQGGFNGTLGFEDYFGGSVLNIGDLDGDGVTDLVVGSYRDNDLFANSGSFYVLFLNANGTVKNHQKVSNLVGGLSSQLSGNAIFGESIDGVIDIDNDGKIEIVVGALRQVNPTLAVPTGAFYIIELNSDGSVSEEHLYTYGENCFSGILNNGDFFGGSVTVLKNGANVSFAVGAYRDSENGGRKGAVWILNLGEVFFTLSNINDPSSCQTNDGSIKISDLTPNSNYTIRYQNNSIETSLNVPSDTNGELLISALAPGIYEDILVTEISTGCSDNLGEATLNGISLNAQITTSNPTVCGAFDGSITISNLAQNTVYSISYQYNSILQTNNFTSNAGNEIQITGLDSGIYQDITISETSGCSENLGQVTLTGSTSTASVLVDDASSCEKLDGSINISNLTQNTLYTISYTFGELSESIDLNSNTNGEILIINLASGDYNDFILTEVSTGCSEDFGSAIVGIINSTIPFSSANPTTCDSLDGEIVIQNLLPNTEYAVLYDHNLMEITINKRSDDNGELKISELDDGVYSNITISQNASNCSQTIDDVIELSCSNDESKCFKEKRFFTPNNDGVNDLWFLELSNKCDYTVFIYDRYGKLLKTLNQDRPTWDGIFNGRKMPATDYWYLVDYTNGTENKIFKSHFSLKR